MTESGQETAEALNHYICHSLTPAVAVLLDPDALVAQQKEAAYLFQNLEGFHDDLVMCLQKLPADRQASELVGPLEKLALEWFRGWSEPRPVSLAPLLLAAKFHAKTTFLLIASTLREVLPVLTAASCFLFLQAVAHLAEFHTSRDPEYIALLIDAVEQAAKEPAYAGRLLEMLRRYYIEAERAGVWNDGSQSSPSSASTRSAQSHLARLWFVVGILANPVLMNQRDFFPKVWPVLMELAAQGMSKSQLRADLALRAHVLASVCLGEVGVSGHTDEVGAYLDVSFISYEERPKEDMCKGLCRLVDVVARRCSECIESEAPDSEAAKRAYGLLNELLQSLVKRIKILLDRGDDESVSAAEGMFRIFCTGARHACNQLVVESSRKEMELPHLLAASGRMRETWLRTVVTGCPEVLRPVLVAQHLEVHPGTAAASRPTGEQGLTKEDMKNTWRLVTRVIAQVWGRFVRAAL